MYIDFYVHTYIYNDACSMYTVSFINILLQSECQLQVSQEHCAGSGDFIRLHVAGASEASTIRSDLNCMLCGHKLEEDIKYRILGGTCV